nr:hypothetical protein [Tanacetum cinerariifolium]
MVFCTSLQEHVFDLQEAKDAQSKEIVALKKKVSKLLKWRKSRSEGLRILMKIGSGRRVKSPLEKDSLDVKTQGRTNEMFGVDDLFGDEVITTVTNKVSVAPTTDVTKDEITMAQALAALKSVKPKVVYKSKRAQQDEETNISWDNTQAIMEDDILLVKRPQAREKEEFSKVQKARLLVDLIEKKKKHFAALRAQEKRNKPPIKAQIRSHMCTYLGNMGGYKHSHLKGRSYDEVKNLFDREMRKINSFIAMDLEAQKSSGKEAQESSTKRTAVNDFIAMDLEAQESSTKRTAEHLEYDISNKQKVNENVEPVIDDTEELENDGKKNYFKIIRADGNSQVYQTFERMFKNFNREDLEVLWAIVKDIFKKEKPVDDMDNILFRTLKTMFEHHSAIYYLLVEKVYPLTRNTLHQLWSDVRLQVDYDVEMAYDLLRFIRKQLMEVPLDLSKDTKPYIRLRIQDLFNWDPQHEIHNEVQQKKIIDSTRDHTGKMSCVTIDSVTPKVLAPGMYAIDVELIPPRCKNNREVHLEYLKHLKESVATICEIIEEARVERPLGSSLASAYLYTKRSQELVEYAVGTCPKDFNKRDKKQATTLLTRKKQVTFADQCETSNNNTHKYTQLKGKMPCVTIDSVTPKVLAPGMYAIDVEPIPPRCKNNREVHLEYLKHLKESVATICEIIEEARVERPLGHLLLLICILNALRS